ncbi:N-acetylmuramoyl-L-alanine amidase [Dactylosporangium sp. NPDC005572]|uniref:peptidoglycan recognition protein family protein n=1 Tax=Dactylosporangium sp. NPDC005572 TaxID=3156889 RepID=UPI0033B22859
MRLTWLADVLRAAGVDVVEVAGWKTRGSDTYGPIRGVIYHGTADKANSGPADARDDAGAIAVIRDGRPGLSGPIAAAYVNREGVWHIIAAGRCNTVKTGWAGPLKGVGNTNVLGVEAENDDRGEPWPPEQLASLRLGFAAILRQLGLPAAKLAGHKEHQPGEKVDPNGIDMDQFRREVAAALAGQPKQATGKPAVQEDDVSALMRYDKDPTGAVFVTDGKTAKWVKNQQELLDRQTLHGDGTLPLGFGGQVRVVGNRALIGTIIGDVPPWWKDGVEGSPKPTA